MFLSFTFFPHILKFLLKLIWINIKWVFMIFNKPKYFFNAPLLWNNRHLLLKSINITLYPLNWHLSFFLYYLIIKLIVLPLANHFWILVFVGIVIVFIKYLFLLLRLNSKLRNGPLVACYQHWRTIRRLWISIEQMSWHLRDLVWVFHISRYKCFLSHWIIPRFKVWNFQVHYFLVLINFLNLLH
jgi:hypothetical protein